MFKWCLHSSGRYPSTHNALKNVPCGGDEAHAQGELGSLDGVEPPGSIHSGGNVRWFLEAGGLDPDDSNPGVTPYYRRLWDCGCLVLRRIAGGGCTGSAEIIRASP